jgi:hypothetical protein
MEKRPTSSRLPDELQWDTFIDRPLMAESRPAYLSMHCNVCKMVAVVPVPAAAMPFDEPHGTVRLPRAA